VTTKLVLIAALTATSTCLGQANSLSYYLSAAEKNNPSLTEYANLLEIGRYENQLITAENSSFQVDVSSEVMVAPYFNNDGKFIDVTDQPSANAYGYAEPISNGALYSAQLNIYKAIFNRAQVADLLFQNRVRNQAVHLSEAEVRHQLFKTVTSSYILVYQLQKKQEINTELVKDLGNRLQVAQILVKKGILQQSDYLLLQLEIDNRKLELQQIGNALKDAKLNLNNAAGLHSGQAGALPPPEIPFDPTVVPAFTTTDQVPMAEVSRALKDSMANRPPPEMEPANTLYTDSLPYQYERKFVNDSLQLLAEQQVFENTYKPQVTLYGNTGLNAVELDRMYHNLGFSAGVKLSVPIYDGGQKRIRQLQKEIQYRNLESRRDNQAVVLQNTLQSLLEQIESLGTSLDLVKAQLQKQEQLLELYKGKMVQGQVSIIDYLKLVENYKMLLDTQLQMEVNRWFLKNEYNATNW